MFSLIGILLTAILLFIAYIIYKIVILPYAGYQFYAKQGAKKDPFFPFLGVLKIQMGNLEKHNDFMYDSKVAASDGKPPRFRISNIFD